MQWLPRPGGRRRSHLPPSPIVGVKIIVGVKLSRGIKMPLQKTWGGRQWQSRCETCRQTTSRRRQQRYNRRVKNQKAKPIDKQIKWEETRCQQEEAQLISQIEHDVFSTHGFLSGLRCSIHQNTCNVLDSTTPGCYFPHPVNSSYHDLTEDKSLPHATTKVLGLIGKFIVKPPYTTADCIVLEKLKCLGRDTALKVYFAGEEELDLNSSKLCLKSKWMPPHPPLHIDSRL